MLWRTTVARVRILSRLAAARARSPASLACSTSNNSPSPTDSVLHELADLGGLLTLSEPRSAPDRSALVDWFAAEQAARARRLLEDPANVLGEATARSLTDLQSGLIAAHRHLHDHGHPVGDP